jgi:opacity protein-like surface antigen
MKKFLAVMFVALFAVSAFAADWGLYGSMRFATFYVNQDSDLSATGDSDTDLRDFGLQGNSRVGAKVKVNDKFSAHLELYVKGNSGGKAVGTRLFYGTYDFGGLKLNIGQMWTPLNVLSIDQVSKGDGDLFGWGAFFTGRNEAVMVDVAGARIALVRNKQSDFTNYDVTIPRIEADYTLKIDPVKARVFAGYQTFSAEDDNATTFDTDSYVAGLDLTGNMGMAGFALTGYYGSNIGAMDAYGPNLAATKSEDTTDFGVAVAVNFKPADNVKVEVGYGYASSDRDDVKDADTQQSYYANVKYSFAKGFFVQPEVAVYDYMDDSKGDTEGKEVYFGAKWQMNF